MRHVPVLFREVIESLQLQPGMNVVDCTLGDAGHSEKILEVTAPNGKLLGIDADPESLLRAKQYLYKEESRTIFVRDNLSNLKEIVTRESFGSVNAVLIDLGWSSPQFADRGRGFSFQKDEPLDMRYSIKSETLNSKSQVTAAQILNESSEQEIEEIFREYGEEKLSKEITAAIVQKRKEGPIERTQQLVNIILETYRKKLKTDKEIPWVGGLHPATKVFQALRIAVNDELRVIEKVLPQAIDILSPGGRLAVITFHSLEDRIVKHFFKSQEKKTVNIITKKPIICSKEEYDTNPPSRSAKLRVVQKA